MMYYMIKFYDVIKADFDLFLKLYLLIYAREFTT